MRTASGAVNGHDSAASGFGMVVKLVQSPLLWSGIEQVPLQFREELAHHYRWRTEAEVYASELAAAM
ncbi:hypothetical protein QMG52_21365 [Paenarthrobacter sp. PH39-S1]|nr:hypothetical protein [Paenarthrobacter sp. PH39-S1]